jgi:hypothetical protein
MRTRPPIRIGCPRHRGKNQDKPIAWIEWEPSGEPRAVLLSVAVRADKRPDGRQAQWEVDETRVRLTENPWLSRQPFLVTSCPRCRHRFELGIPWLQKAATGRPGSWIEFSSAML